MYQKTNIIVPTEVGVGYKMSWQKKKGGVGGRDSGFSEVCQRSLQVKYFFKNL